MSLASDKKYQIPPKVLQSYFERIAKDGTLFICLVSTGVKSAFYMENSNDPEDTVEGIVRVFISLDDLRNYAQMICASEGIEEESTRKWEVRPSKIVEYFSELSKSYEDSGKKPVRVVVCTIIGTDLVELDVLWTSEKEKML